MRHESFTLVELLVVIAIIAILAGLLLPTTCGGGRTSARRAQCLSNQKQMALGAIMFANEHDKKMPFEATFAEAGDGEADVYLKGGARIAEEAWESPLIGVDPEKAELTYGGLTGTIPASAQANGVYINRLYGQGNGLIPDARVFYCNASRNTGPTPVGTDAFGLENWWGYGINLRVRGSDPSSMPNALLHGDLGRATIDLKKPRYRSLDEAPSAKEAAGLNHNGEGFNFAYVDGHAKWIKSPGGKATAMGVPDSSDTLDVFMSSGNGAEGQPPMEDVAIY